MPIYEYWCSGCRKKVEILFLRTRESKQPVCPHCKGLELRRLVSRFSSPKSEEARLESLADPSRLAGLDENDPAGMARWVRRMGRELGEDIGGEEIDQVAEEIAAGGGPGSAAGEPAPDVPGGPSSGDL